MQDDDLHIFCDPDAPSAALSFAGLRDESGFIEGRILAGEKTFGEVYGGVASFVTEKCNWTANEIAHLRSTGRIAKSWSEGLRTTRDAHRERFAEKLAKVAGCILEVAIGPGGGNVPRLLNHQPVGRILVNDISSDILGLWREELGRISFGKGVCFAAFDVREPILRGGSIAAVSCCGAFGGIIHTTGTVNAIGLVACILRNLFTTLEPGGSLFLSEYAVDRKEAMKLPRQVRLGCEIERYVFSYQEAVACAGFEITFSARTSHRIPVDGAIGLVAREYGVALYRTREHIEARKP